MNDYAMSTRCVLRFARNLTAEDREQIMQCLLEAGLRGPEFVQDTCTVHYFFPDMTLGMIHEKLTATDPALKPVIGLYDTVIIFLENNERSYVTCTGGWKHNVEDVYIHYFNRYSIEREDIRRQTWRKYKE